MQCEFEISWLRLAIFLELLQINVLMLFVLDSATASPWTVEALANSQQKEVQIDNNLAP